MIRVPQLEVSQEQYLPFYPAQEQKILDLSAIEPHSFDSAVAPLDDGRMPNRAGVFERKDGLAALDLVTVEFIMDDDYEPSWLIVHPGMKSDVDSEDKTIQARRDVLLSLPDDIVRPFGRSFVRPPVDPDWSNVGRGRSTRWTSHRQATYAHRRPPQPSGMSVARFRPGHFPNFRIEEIEGGVILASRED